MPKESVPQTGSSFIERQLRGIPYQPRAPARVKDNEIVGAVTNTAAQNAAKSGSHGRLRNKASEKLLRLPAAFLGIDVRIASEISLRQQIAVD